MDVVKVQKLDLSIAAMDLMIVSILNLIRITILHIIYYIYYYMICAMFDAGHIWCYGPGN